MSVLEYTPSPSVEPFLTSDKFQNFIVGPVGSTKTTASIVKIAYEASRMAPCRDGIRRSRCVVVRNTRQMLWDTTIPDFLKWFPNGDAGILYKTDSKFLLKLDGVECEVLFRGLDDADDVRRLLSLQLSFGMLDEFREINPDVFNQLTSRLGRYPDGMMVPHRPEWGYDDKGNPIQGCVDDAGRQMKKVWGATNPPDRDTFWEQYLSDPEDNCHVTIQPSGLSPEADWVQHLPSGYYEDIIVGKTEEWIDVYVHGKWGKSLAGMPVFRCFDRDIHVAKTPLIVQASTLILGVDAGLNPTAVITQPTYNGRVLVHKAITGTDMGMGALRFIREKLKPTLAAEFAGKQAMIVIDPAAFQRAQTDERTVADIYKAEGFMVKPALTNTLAARLAVVESYMTRTVEGQSALLINQSETELIKALAGKYRYKINTKGVQDDVPEKSHPWSDYCFVAGTPVLTPTGQVPIETLRVGDTVITPEGQNRILAAACVSRAAEVWEYVFSDGSSFVATSDHPVYVESEKGFVPLDKLRYADILVSISTEQERTQWQKSRNSGLTESVSPSSQETTISGISDVSPVGSGQLQCIGTSGSTTTAQFPTCELYTTKTTTRTTTTSAILSYVNAENTSANIWLCESLMGTPVSTVSSERGKLQENGMEVLRVERGTVPTPNRLGQIGTGLLKIARIAASPMKFFAAQRKEGFVPQPVNLPHVERAGSITLRVVAPYVAPSLFATSIQKSRHAVTLVGKRKLPQPAAVYTLQVKNEAMYFASGVLVKNCDGLQYACLQHDGGAAYGMAVTTARREIKPAPLAWARC